jgi:hypothetical protein
MISIVLSRRIALMSVRSREPDIRDPRHGESPHVAWQRVCGLDGGQDGVVGDRLGLAAGPHPLPAKIVVM